MSLSLLLLRGHRSLIALACLAVGLLAASADDAAAQTADLSLALAQGTEAPRRYAVYEVTATLTNDGPDAATGVRVALPLPEGVVFEGGNEFAASQGIFRPNGRRTWEVGTLAAGAEATITLRLYLLAPTAPDYYGQVVASDAFDPDSTPDNGAPGSVTEDDEASVRLGTGDAGGDPGALADLQVSIGFGGISAFETDATIFPTIQNVGDGAARVPFDTRFYLSDDPILDEGDALLATLTLPGLGAGERVSPRVEYSLAGVPNKTYFLIAEVDALDALAEVNEYFNFATNLLSVRIRGNADANNPIGFDLVGGQLEVITPTTNPGGRIDFSYRLAVSGNRPELTIGDVVARVYISRVGDVVPNAIVGPSLVFEGPINGDDLLPAQRASIDVGDLPPGDYFLVVRADEQNVYSESSEANNEVARAFSIVDGPGGERADLVLSRLVAPNRVVAVGGRLDYTFDLANLGQADVPGDFAVQAYFSRDRAVSPDDLADGTIVTGNFASGNRSTGIRGASTARGLAPGEYFLLLRADDGGVVPELSEENNLAAVPVTVIPAPGGGGGGGGGEGVDLELAITQPAAPARYAVFETTVTATNAGTEPATGVVVRAPRPEGVVYEGGNEFVASQGTFTTFGDERGRWRVGTLAPGATATLTIRNYLLAPEAPASYAQVLAQNEPDVDSAPGNGTPPTVNEDDEASTEFGTGGDPDGPGTPGGEYACTFATPFDPAVAPAVSPDVSFVAEQTADGYEFRGRTGTISRPPVVNAVDVVYRLDRDGELLGGSFTETLLDDGSDLGVAADETVIIATDPFGVVRRFPFDIPDVGLGAVAYDGGDVVALPGANGYLLFVVVAVSGADSDERNALLLQRLDEDFAPAGEAELVARSIFFGGATAAEPTPAGGYYVRYSAGPSNQYLFFGSDYRLATTFQRFTEGRSFSPVGYRVLDGGDIVQVAAFDGRDPGFSLEVTRYNPAGERIGRYFTTAGSDAFGERSQGRSLSQFLIRPDGGVVGLSAIFADRTRIEVRDGTGELVAPENDLDGLINVDLGGLAPDNSILLVATDVVSGDRGFYKLTPEGRLECGDGSGSDLGVDLELAIAQPASPRRYAVYETTLTLTNAGSEPASGVAVRTPRPEGVVYEGGNEFVATQGTFATFGERRGTWTVGALAPGATATLTIRYYLLAPEAPASYAQVTALSEADVDSAPDNGTPPIVNEDDEAVTSGGTAARSGDLAVVPSVVRAGSAAAVTARLTGVVAAQRAEIVVSDLAGRVVRRTASELLAGDNDVAVETTGLAPGVYVVAATLPGVRPIKLVVR